MNLCLVSKHAAAVPGIQLYSRLINVAIHKDQVEAKSKESILESEVNVKVSRGAECSGVIVIFFTYVISSVLHCMLSHKDSHWSSVEQQTVTHSTQTVTHSAQPDYVLRRHTMLLPMRAVLHSTCAASC